MPMQRSHYPADWEAISKRIRFERAGSKCEWCGAPHEQFIVRDRQNPASFRVPANGMEVESSQDRGEWVVWVILTTAHLGTPKADGTPGDKHDKLDVREENLAALCQRCHLNFDREDHIRHARENRASRRGQLALAAVLAMTGVIR